MAAIVATIILATAAGIAAERRFGGRAGIAARRSLLFVLYVVLPPATFFNLAAAEIELEAWAGIGIAWASLAATVALVYLLGTRVLALSGPAIGAVLCCALVANTGYLGYPLVAALFGLDRLGEAVVYDVLVSAPALLLGAFSIGAAFGDRAGEGVRGRVRAFFTRNPPLYAAALALVAPDSLAPEPAVDAARIAIVAILPLGFFAVGAALAEEAEEGAMPLPPPFDAPVALGFASRLLVAPAFLFLLAAPLVDLPDIYLLLAAMPCGVNVLVVTHAYGLDLRIAAGAVAWTTAVAVLVIAIAAVVRWAFGL